MMTSQLNTMNRCGTGSSRNPFVHKEKKEDEEINTNTYGGSESTKWKSLHWNKKNKSLNASFKGDLYNSKDRSNLKKKKISEIINKYKKSIQRLPMQFIQEERSGFIEGRNRNHTEETKFTSEKYINKSEKEVSNKRKPFLHSNNTDQLNEKMKESELNDSSMDSTNCVEITQKKYKNIHNNLLHNKYLYSSTKEQSDYNSNSIHWDENPNKKGNEIQIVKKELTRKEEPVIVMNLKEKEYDPKQGSNHIMINQIKKKYLGRNLKETPEAEINDIMYMEMEKNKKLNDNNLSLYEKKQIYLDYEREKQIDFKKSLILKNNEEDYHKISKEENKITVEEGMKDPFDVDKKKTIFNEHIYFDEKRIRDAFKEIELMEHSIRTKNLLSNKENPVEQVIEENVLTSVYTKKDPIKPVTDNVQNNISKIKVNVEHMKYNITNENNPISNNDMQNYDTKDQIDDENPFVMHINEKRKDIKEKPFYNDEPMKVNIKEEPMKIEELKNKNDSYELHKNKEEVVNRLVENEQERELEFALYELQNNLSDKIKDRYSLNKKTDPIKNTHSTKQVTKPEKMNCREFAESVESKVKRTDERKQALPWEKSTIDRTDHLKRTLPRRNLSEQIPREKNEIGPIKKKNASENVKFVSRTNNDTNKKKKTNEIIGNRSLSKMDLDEENDVFQQPNELIKKEMFSEDYFKKKYEEVEHIKRALEEKIVASTLGPSIDILDKNKKNRFVENFKDSLSMFDDPEEGEKGIVSRYNKVDTLQSINLNRSKKEEPVKNRFEPIDHFNRMLLEKKLSQSWRNWGNKEDKVEQGVQEEKKETSGEKIKETLEILKENGLESKNVVVFDENDIQDEIKKKRKMYEIKIRKDFEERIKMRRKEHDGERNELEENRNGEEAKLKEQKKKQVKKNKKDLFEEFSTDGSYYKRVYRDLYEDQCNKKMKSYFYDVSDNLYLQDCSDHFFSNTQKSSIYLKERRPSINLDSESVSLSKIKFDDFDYNYLNRLDEIKYPRGEVSSVHSVESEQGINKSLLVLSPQKPQVVFSENESYEKSSVEKTEEKNAQSTLINNLTKEISSMNENITELNDQEEKDVSNVLDKKENDNILCKLIQRKIVGGKRERKEQVTIGTNGSIILESQKVNTPKSKTMSDKRFPNNKNINKKSHERNEVIELQEEKNEKSQSVLKSKIEKAKSNLNNLENVILQIPRNKRISMKDEEVENIKTEKVETIENNKKGRIFNKKDNTDSFMSKRVNRKQTVENHKGNNDLFDKEKLNQKDIKQPVKNIVDKNMETIDITEKAQSIVSSSDLTLPKINILKDQENYIPLDIALNLVMDNQNLKKTIQKDNKKGTTKKKTFVQWLMDERKRRLKNNLPLDI